VENKNCQVSASFLSVTAPIWGGWSDPWEWVYRACSGTGPRLERTLTGGLRACDLGANLLCWEHDLQSSPCVSSEDRLFPKDPSSKCVRQSAWECVDLSDIALFEGGVWVQYEL
jgi:hypothetical protein